MIVVYVLVGLVLLYLVFTLFLTYLVQQIPRYPVEEKPDWGHVEDRKIPTAKKKALEVWRIEPKGTSRGIVVFGHGWGRNRDRMVYRARMFGEMGYTTVIHSARDHGGSSPERLMNAVKFAEDIEAVLGWVGEPVILYGHSAGAAGAIIAAHRNPEKITRLFLEACYADTQEALLSLYRWVNPVFGNVFGPAIISWMKLFYLNGLSKVDPALLAKDIKMPVMLIHGEKDARFPLAFAERLKASFTHGQVDMYVAPGADHSDSSKTGGYRQAVTRFLDRTDEQAT